MTYTVYLLTLPSGHVVRVRKPGSTGLLAKGALVFPLLQASLNLADDDEDVAENDQSLAAVHAICRAVLVDDVPPDLLPWFDRLALVAWATTEIDDNVPVVEEREWKAADFLPLVQGRVAPFLDAVCHRYGVTPSRYLKLEHAVFSADLDMAVAFRGLRQASRETAGEELIEERDVYGNVFHVPAKYLPAYDIPAGTKVIKADSIAARYGPLARRHGYVGFGDSCGADGAPELMIPGKGA